MKYLKSETWIGDADCSQDAVKPQTAERARLEAIEARLAEEDLSGTERLDLMTESGYLLLDLERREDAWQRGREALPRAVETEAWDRAVEACDIMFQSEHEEAGRALGHGIWLGVTYPIDPELSVAMLNHLVEQLPGRNDGAAVAAATALYIVKLRAEGKMREDLEFFASKLLGEVAREHSQVDEQEVFDFWVERLELNDPERFLPRLGKVVDVLVGDEWWFDRDALRARIPEA